MQEQQLMTEEQWAAKHQVEIAGKKKKKWKNRVKSLIALLLVVVISVAGTLAYLSKQADKKVNTFTGSDGLKLDLQEPGWKDPTNQGFVYMPDQPITKNPIVINGTATLNADGSVDTNSGGGTYDEYVAIRVAFYADANLTVPVTYKDIQDAIIDPIEFKTSEWQLYEKGVLKEGSPSSYKNNGAVSNTDLATSSKFSDSNCLTFVYGTNPTTLTKLEKDASANKNVSSPLFEKVQIRDGKITGKPIKALENDGTVGAVIADGAQLPNFYISISAAAVDASGTDATLSDAVAIKTALSDTFQYDSKS